jgi:tetratricopeptide (TPR) repeat protein
MRKLIILILFFVSIGFSVSFASTEEDLMSKGNQLYQSGNFDKAADMYQKVVDSGYESPSLYFNLGNAYYKLDKIGMSVLNYERAKKFSPQDEDINFNLKLANQKTLDKIEPAPKLFLEDWWDNLKSMHAERIWGIRSISCFLLFLFFLGVFITTQRILSKQIGFWLSLVFFIFTLISFFISKSRYNDLSNQNAAVILSSSVEIKNSPSDAGTKLFILHEGTKVAAPENKGDWVKIELTSEKVGWVKKSEIEFI